MMPWPPVTSGNMSREGLHDVSRPYPANYFRLQMLLNSFASKDIKRVLEVGVGEGTPLSTLAKAGVDVWGFDISPKMVEASRARMRENGMSPDHILSSGLIFRIPPPTRKFSATDFSMDSWPWA
jgi:2-polyprenyl-3-methyl-5-hydroxy-6-metoxy-1,4-benzoquinol methylase